MPACAGMTWLVDELKLMNSSFSVCVFDVQNDQTYNDDGRGALPLSPELCIIS